MRAGHSAAPAGALHTPLARANLHSLAWRVVAMQARIEFARIGPT